MWLWVFALIILLISYWYLSVPRKLPPGSSGLPLLGYLPFLGREVHVCFEQLGKKYGNVFHLYMGSRLIVVLNDYQAIREAFIKQGDVFAGRPADAQFQESKEDNLGITATDGEYWKQHRRFILTNLRDNGVGKLTLEPLLLNELQYCLAEIKKSQGKNFAIKQLLSNSLANNIHILVTGKRYNYNDPTTAKLNVLFKRAETAVPQLPLLLFFPWLIYVPGSEMLIQQKAIRKLIKDFLDVISGIVKSVKSEYKEGQRENYVHAFMDEKNSRAKTNKKETIFTDVGLLHNTRDLLFAGTETSATTLHWAMLYMTMYPKIQKKVQTEINQIIGKEREPSYNDRVHMPYTEATIMELHRIITLVPLSAAHRTVRDTTVLGHFIPKDTMIIPNLYAVHYDTKIWKDPENFRPERFIGSDGKVIKSEHLIPFSLGKRACAGEPLARMELFLYFVSLLQNFEFVTPDGEKPNLEVHMGQVRRPKFQYVKVKSRK